MFVTMFSFKFITAVVLVISAVFATPADLEKRLDSRELPGSGTLEGRYYYWWPNSHTTFNLISGGGFSISWSGSGGVLGGTGWNPGRNRTIRYSGNYNPNGNSYLSVYGWTRNPLIEYYIVESYGTYDPTSGGQKKGNITCDGANYDILSTVRVNQPSIDGTQTFQQFWSVRNPKKIPGIGLSGSVNTTCHFEAWKGAGMRMGSEFNYQIVAVEAYFSSGSATISVS